MDHSNTSWNIELCVLTEMASIQKKFVSRKITFRTSELYCFHEIVVWSPQEVSTPKHLILKMPDAGTLTLCLKLSETK